MNIEHTINMSEGTEDTSWTVAVSLNIITFGRLIYFRMKLLFCSSMAIATIVSIFTVSRFSPLITVFDVWARSGSGEPTQTS